MKELLRRWSELEPNRCGKPGDVWQVMRETWCSAEWFGGFDYDRIQGAVQGAIEARGWQWELHGSKAYSEAVVKHVSIDMKIKNADSPAEALLSAYLAVLDTRKERIQNENH